MRDISELTPDMQAKAKRHMELMAERDVPILIYSTYRDFHEQAKLYRQGRPFAEIHAKAEELSNEYKRPDLARILIQVGPQFGPKRTNAGPGQSVHNYRMAYDGVPMRAGEPVWGDTTPEDERLWTLYGEKAKEAGLAWGGDWPSFTDKPHCYEPSADWHDLICEGEP